MSKPVEFEKEMPTEPVGRFFVANRPLITVGAEEFSIGVILEEPYPGCFAVELISDNGMKSSDAGLDLVFDKERLKDVLWEPASASK
ncbi:MAG: hypothetical protein ABSE45_13415 [Candidatus Acidiferrales bacterium]|jgi:hypothetical protein